MKYQDFRKIFENSSEKSINPVENAIYTIKKNPTKGIQLLTGYTQKQISERYDLSRRIVEEWASGRITIPQGKACMLAFCVLSDLEMI